MFHGSSLEVVAHFILHLFFVFHFIHLLTCPSSTAAFACCHHHHPCPTFIVNLLLCIAPSPSIYVFHAIYRNSTSASRVTCRIITLPYPVTWTCTIIKAWALAFLFIIMLLGANNPKKRTEQNICAKRMARSRLYMNSGR